MASYLITDDEVIIDGRDVSDSVVSITVELADQADVTRMPASVAAQQLGQILDKLMRLADVDEVSQ